MLPKYLTSSYQQYKGDTDAVASWLATTSAKCGYSSDLLHKESAIQQPKSGRLKGKARMRARGRANRSLSSKATPKNRNGRSTYTIAIKDFTSLAEYIASYDKLPVQVPASFTAALDRAIAVRKYFMEAVSSQLPQTGQSKATDERHSFFLDVLEHVREILRPRMPADQSWNPVAQAARPDHPKDMEGLVNMFETLEVYEPSEEFIQAPDLTHTSQGSAESAPNYEAERLQSIEEDFLAFHLHLVDLSKLRTEISRTWAGYKMGIFSLVAASITTNTAIDLARAMEEDLESVFAKHGGSETMLRMFFHAQCIQAGQDESYREIPGDDMNFKMYDVADCIFLPTYLLLDAFRDLVDPKYMPEYKPGYFGTYDPTSDRSLKSNREKFKEDKIVLLEILPEFYILCTGTENVLAEDEFTRGLRLMFKRHKIPLWLAFAARVFLDINNTLRQEVGRGFAELTMTSNLVASSIKQNLQFHSSIRIDNWPPSNDFVFQDLLERINDWVFTDPIQKAKSTLKRKNLGKPFQLMKQHPLFCGLWKYQLQSLYQEYSIVFANAWGSIMYSGHLYNAVRSEKLLGAEWRDMKLVFALQGFDVFFVGDPPHEPEDYLKQFCLAMGYSATALAKGKRKGQLEASKKGPKALVELAPVAQMFNDRYCHSSGRVDVTAKYVEKILKNSNWKIEENIVSNRANDEVVSLTREKRVKAQLGKKQPQDQRVHKLSTTRLLENLRNVLQAEMLELSIDYLALHRLCWQTLRLVKSKCEEQLIATFGPDYIEKENQLPFVIGYIFMAATNSAQLGKMFKPKKSEVEVSSVLLTQAADAIQGMVDGGGGDFVSKKILEEKYGLVSDFEEDAQ